MKKLLSLFLLFFFIGCAPKTTPVIVAFKNSGMAINDQGFLQETPFYKQIEVYNVGELVFVLTIKKNDICINNRCYDKTLFVHNLNPNYPSNLFDLILERRPIPDIKEQKINGGFIQKSDNFIYIVTDKKVLFKDKKGNFLFLLKKS
jgi:hypothetical protein